MSILHELISIKEDKLIINEESIDFLNTIKEQIILIPLISQNDDQNKTSLLSSITGVENISNDNKIKLYETKITQEEENNKILFLDIPLQNYNQILSSLILCCPLFILFVNEELKEDELLKFNFLNDINNNILINKPLTFTDISPNLYFIISNPKYNFPKDYLDKILSKKSDNSDINSLKQLITKFFIEKNFIINNKKNKDLIDEILIDIKPKSLYGKIFNGFALSEFFKYLIDICNKKEKFDLGSFLEKSFNN